MSKFEFCCYIVNAAAVAWIQFDPTVDYRSLKEEFSAEDAGANYGDKRLYVRMPDGTVKRRRSVKRRNFSTSARERK